MLAVMVFETREVPFETVGGRRDSWVVEVMKHMWQCFEQHAAGAYEVADYPATVRDLRQFEAIAVLPSANGGEEGISLNRSADRRNSEEYFPQKLGVRAGWTPPTPHQALALDMHQAALDDSRRPQGLNHSDGLWVAVEGATDRRQPMDLKRLEERRELTLRVLVNSILAMDYLAPDAIHDGDEATTLIQEGSVEDQVVRKKHLDGCRWPVEPVAYDTSQCRRAETAEISDLAYAESFGQPPFEPYSLVVEAPVDSPPMERSPAVETPPSLTTVAVMTVPFDSVAPTLWAMFFSDSYRDHGTTSIMRSTSH